MLIACQQPLLAKNIEQKTKAEAVSLSENGGVSNKPIKKQALRFQRQFVFSHFTQSESEKIIRERLTLAIWGRDYAPRHLISISKIGINYRWLPKPDQESGKIMLHCVAHDRTIQCRIEEARTWQEGTGVIGVAYSNARETIVPDMYAPELGSTYDLRGNTRAHDRERYHSMVAVPIIVGDKKIPWGVAAATSNRAYHFNIYPVDGVATAEPARAIAAMAALTVKAVMSGSIPQEGPTADRKEPKS